MKTRILILFMLISYLKSMSQATVIEPGKSTIKSVNVSAELDITNYGSVASIVGKRANGTTAAPTNILNGDNLFVIKGTGYTGSDGFQIGASINFLASESWTNTSRGTDIRFLTTPNGTNVLNTAVTIKNNGFMGIGTSNPLANLHIAKGFSTVVPFYNSAMFIESNENTYLTLASSLNHNAGIYFKNNADPIGAKMVFNADSTFVIQSGNAKLSFAKRGNVGIGVDNVNPKASLDIDGDFALTSVRILAINTTHHDLNRTKSTVIRAQKPLNLASSTETITGFASGSPGVILYVYPTSNTTIILKHEDTGSLAENRIVCHTGADISLVNDGGATLMYDIFLNRWKVISIAN